MRGASQGTGITVARVPWQRHKAGEGELLGPSLPARTASHVTVAPEFKSLAWLCAPGKCLSLSEPVSTWRGGKESRARAPRMEVGC